MVDGQLKPTDFIIGGDLYGVSRDELVERISLLETEIIRVRAELTKKQTELGAAEQIFGKRA